MRWQPVSRRRSCGPGRPGSRGRSRDRKSTRLNSSHLGISYAVFCLKKKKKILTTDTSQPYTVRLPVYAIPDTQVTFTWIPDSRHVISEITRHRHRMNLCIHTYVRT